MNQIGQIDHIGKINQIDRIGQICKIGKLGKVPASSYTEHIYIKSFALRAFSHDDDNAC